MKEDGVQDALRLGVVDQTLGGIHVVDQQIFEVLEEPFVWYESPIVIEPEKNIVCNHRVVGAASAFGNSTIAGAEKWRVIGSTVGQHHELIQLTQNIGELS